MAVVCVLLICAREIVAVQHVCVDTGQWLPRRRLDQFLWLGCPHVEWLEKPMLVTGWNNKTFHLPFSDASNGVKLFTGKNTTFSSSGQDPHLGCLAFFRFCKPLDSDTTFLLIISITQQERTRSQFWGNSRRGVESYNPKGLIISVGSQLIH